jgi:hypothetical protein
MVHIIHINSSVVTTAAILYDGRLAWALDRKGRLQHSVQRRAALIQWRNKWR